MNMYEFVNPTDWNDSFLGLLATYILFPSYTTPQIIDTQSKSGNSTIITKPFTPVLEDIGANGFVQKRIELIITSSSSSISNTLII